jgi:hypothetical protein
VLKYRGVVVRILIPLFIVMFVMAGFYWWYTKKMADMQPGDSERSLPGARLTSERLRSMPHPPWRVVFEIGEKSLGNIDHVVIGPCGAIAIETIMADRPSLEAVEAQSNAAQVMANAAITRGELDDVTSAVGVPCKLLAKVYWGTPVPDQPAGIAVTEGLVAVEGQRLEQWLMMLPPGSLGAAQVDQVWQAVLTGIGRPDPLA